MIEWLVENMTKLEKAIGKYLPEINNSLKSH